MMKKFFCLVCAAILISPVFAGESGTEAPGQKRPKVGLVLSGGGAKGVAHIGVFKLLEELDIPVDYIVGTSIGSIMGGLYALGYSADDLDSIVRVTDWDMIMQDNFQRRSILFEDKKRNEEMIIRIPFSSRSSFEEESGNRKAMRDLEGKKSKSSILNAFPTALVEGQNLHSLFTNLTVGYQDDVDFNTFPIPFACVAVDLNTKKEVVFHSGDIVKAIRASMSIPGYFTPVKIGDQFLVDGGMLNNFPVDVAREMGADIVIGVDLHKYDNSRTKPVENLGDMIGSMLGVMNGTKYQEGLDNADIVVAPNTSDFGVLGFDEKSVKALIDTGYVTAVANREALEKLAEQQHRLGGHNVNRRPERRKAIDLTQDSVRVGQMSFEGEGAKEIGYLMKKSRLRIGESVTAEEIDQLVDAMYLSGAYSKIEYSLAGNQKDSSYNLKFRFTPEKPHEIGLGLRFDTEEMASILLDVEFFKHKLFGWKFDCAFKLGVNPVIAAGVGYALNNYWQINLDCELRKSNLEFYNEGKKTSSAEVARLKPCFYFQHKRRNSDLHIGIRGELDRHSSIIGSASEFEEGTTLSDRFMLAYLSYELDNRDKSYFAHRGFHLDTEAGYAFLGNGYVGETKVRYNYLDFRLGMAGYIPVGRHFTIIPQLYSRIVTMPEGEGFSYVSNIVGGIEPGRYFEFQLPFVGESHNYTAANAAAVARADFQLHFLKKSYVTAMANCMADADRLENIFNREGRFNYGFGLQYALDTFIGPISLTGEWSSFSKKFGVYFSLGYSF